MGLAEDFCTNGAQVVALCENNKERTDKALKEYGNEIAVYTDFDEFLCHDMDAVVLANYFHEHTPFAIKCFEKGLHVYSECLSNGTMAEGVELIKAFEKSNSIYMLAENYPHMIFNREMKRICDGGSLGKIIYAEGEYNHPLGSNDEDYIKNYNYYTEHWRNYLPSSYYITHSLGPVMWSTGATPRRVTSFASFAPITDEVATAKNNGDRVSIVTTQNDDGSIFRITGCANFGAHHNAYRICGLDGQVENIRGTDRILLRYNEWSKPKGKEQSNLYEPVWNEDDEEAFRKSGHGGADFFACRMFLECIRNNKQPEHPFDIYSAVNMASVAILAHRSMLDGGRPYDIPDFTKEEDCRLYENDRLSPFYGSDGSKPTIPCCSNPDFKPTEKQLELYNKILNNID